MSGFSNLSFVVFFFLTEGYKKFFSTKLCASVSENVGNFVVKPFITRKFIKKKKKKKKKSLCPKLLCSAV